MNRNLKKIKDKYLISGSSSGLGKYLHDQLGGSVFNREGENVEGAEVIIHCAVNRAKEVDSKNLYQYLSDNVFLTKKIAKNPHKKFIYISSVDVYPKDSKKHFENEIIDVNQVSGIYAIAKLMSESIVQNFCQNYLILRCSSLLGRDSKENTLIKIIKEENPILTISSESVFNFILYKDVLEFIKIATEKDLQGVYNLVSDENITLLEIVQNLGKKVNFGNYFYSVGCIDNNKVRKVVPNFKKNSKKVVSEFIKL